MPSRRVPPAAAGGRQRADRSRPRWDHAHGGAGFGREVEKGFRRASARLGAREGLSRPGAAREIPMFAFDTDYDPVGPATDAFLAEIGLDARSVREALSEDRARRCPDSEAPADRS